MIQNLILYFFTQIFKLILSINDNEELIREKNSGYKFKDLFESESLADGIIILCKFFMV